MPFYISDTINYFADAFLRVSAVRTIANNPIYSAMMISIVIMIIIMLIFRNVQTDEPMSTLVLRSGLWVFIFLTGALLLHNKVLLIETTSNDKTAAYEDIFQPRGEYTFEGPIDFTKT